MYKTPHPSAPRRAACTLVPIWLCFALAVPVARAQSVTPDDSPAGNPIPAPVIQAPPPPVAPAGPVYTPMRVPTPEVYITLEKRRRWNLFTSGLILFGGSFISTLLLDTDDNARLVPFAGPFIAIANLGGKPSCSDPNPLGLSCVDPTQRNLVDIALTLEGLAQLGGLAMAIVGVATFQKVPVFKERVVLAPIFSPTMTGLVAAGRF